MQQESDRPPTDSRPKWLHRHIHGLITFAARAYFRVTRAGVAAPATGPLLLVANHPNSLVDAALMAEAAQRPVRFLARAPLFQKRDIGWLVRSSGAIPVYRRQDAPELMGRNTEMFSAATEALRAGDAVGIFPEGLSHSAPALAPIKTGAARIALDAARLRGEVFPILPVGLTFRGGKDRFRSQALVLTGRPVRWDDLTGATSPDMDPVRELTGRIEASIDRITVNLESWDDFPLIEIAEAVHDSEFGKRRRSRNPVRWLARMRRTAQALARARSEHPDLYEPLARDLIRHSRMLGVVGLQPSDLSRVPRARVAVRWTLQNLIFFGFALPLALLGFAIFLVPTQLIRWIESRVTVPPDQLATARLLGGAAIFAGWILLIAAGLREWLGWRAALGALGLLPALGILNFRIRDRWRDAVQDLRRFLFLRGRRDLRTRLLERQKELAERIREFQREI